MKSARPSKAKSSAPGEGVAIIPQHRFKGTDNSRHLRAIAALLSRPISRQELDTVAGCANGPALVSDLRDLGLTLDCTRIRFIDRDGRPCNPGVYSFDAGDRRKVFQWQAKRPQGGRLA